MGQLTEGINRLGEYLKDIQKGELETYSDDRYVVREISLGSGEHLELHYEVAFEGQEVKTKGATLEYGFFHYNDQKIKLSDDELEIVGELYGEL